MTSECNGIALNKKNQLFLKIIEAPAGKYPGLFPYTRKKSPK
jgi:hypothetical protein